MPPKQNASEVLLVTGQSSTLLESRQKYLLEIVVLKIFLLFFLAQRSRKNNGEKEKATFNTKWRKMTSTQFALNKNATGLASMILVVPLNYNSL